jgi:transposase
MTIVDAQSVKNTCISKSSGYDAGKKIAGIKRHIAVDTGGRLQALCITTANVTDRNGAIELVKDNQDTLKDVETLTCDGGYTGENFANQIKYINTNTKVEIVKRSDLNKTGFELLPKRWIVERCFAWLDRCRRLWKNCETDSFVYQ